MISAFIAYDEQDVDLGLFFTESHNDLSAFLTGEVSVDSLSLSSAQCTESNVENCLKKLNGNKFIFIAICHGNPEQIGAPDIFVSKNNSFVFANSLFYTCSCSSGLKLGPTLVADGCLVFVGYDDVVYIVEDYSATFYACQNFGIKSFLSKSESIESSYKSMIDHYTAEIDKLVLGSIDDFVAASYLMNNRDCLVLHGNGSLTNQDFHIN